MAHAASAPPRQHVAPRGRHRAAVLPQRHTARPRRAPLVCAAAAGGSADAAGAGVRHGLFVCSGSPAVAEACCYSGLDWICIDGQHGPVGFDTLSNMLAATARTGVKRIVRVGGPDDRYAMQQALDLGADGVMVPLINSVDDARRAIAACKYAPQGVRSIAYPIRGAYGRGEGLADYLRSANDGAEVWLQVETKECLGMLDEVVAVPGLTCAFLGPFDLSISLGLAHKHDLDVAAALWCPEMQEVYARVVQACRAAGVLPGVACVGADRAAALAGKGYHYIATNTDLAVLIGYGQSMAAALKPGGA